MRTVVSAVVASLIATSAVALSSVTDVGAVPSPDVVISQVYGGGGNAGATITNDFIELYNRGTETVPLDGWSVQYASQAGTTWTPTPLTGILPPGSYYLVQEAAGTGGTTPLPTPDAAGSIAMSGTNGKVALVTSSAALSCGSNCDTAAGVRDFVGYGAGANDFETAPTATLSNTTAAIRAAGGVTDTDNNSADFAVGAPTPRNCGAPCIPPPPPIPPVQISEIHYDNDGADTGEAIEVTGPADVNLAGWSLVLYNLTGGAVYDTIALSGVLPDEGSGLGAAAFPIAAIQNGPNDGIALVEPLGSVVEFLSYEGTLTALNGPANGMTSTDIGVSEDETTPAGFSLQLLGDDWIGPVASSFGVVNFVPRICPLATDVTPIHEAQGSGAATPCPGEDITIEGVVVADFEGAAPTLRGFYVQEEDSDVDGDPATSEALFVFNASNNNVAVGDAVRITGVVAEFQGQTQINFPDVLTILSAGEHAADGCDRDAAIRGPRLARGGRGHARDHPGDAVRHGVLPARTLRRGARIERRPAAAADRQRGTRRAGAGDAGGKRPEPADHRRHAQQPERRPDRVRRQWRAVDGGQPPARWRHHHGRDRRDDVHLGR